VLGRVVSDPAADRPVPGYRRQAAQMRWLADDGTRAFHDRIRVPDLEAVLGVLGERRRQAQHLRCPGIRIDGDVGDVRAGLVVEGGNGEISAPATKRGRSSDCSIAAKR